MNLVTILIETENRYIQMVQGLYLRIWLCSVQRYNSKESVSVINILRFVILNFSSVLSLCLVFVYYKYTDRVMLGESRFGEPL